MSSGHSINRYIVRNIKIIIGVKIMKKVSRISKRMERDKEILEAAIKARTEDGIKQGPVYKMINMSMEYDSTDQNQQADEKTVTVKFEIDRDIYDHCVEAFTALGTTIEEMALAFIKFCVKNPEVISAYIKEDADEELKQEVFEAVYAIAAKTKRLNNSNGDDAEK